MTFNTLKQLLPLILLGALACDTESSRDSERALPLARQPDGNRPDARQSTDSAGDPAAVIRGYYYAIARGDYARAYQQWEDDGKASGQSFEQFRAGFTETSTVRAEIGEPGPIEGAAGSRYAVVPVSILAMTSDGREQGFVGTYTLRRAVVPGAMEAARRWHIYSAEMQPCDPVTCRAHQEVRAVVREFGRRLARVSLQAPSDTVRRALRDEYGALVTPGLLAAWQSDPAIAPGRSVSSPWPQRIVVRKVQPLDPRHFEVVGDVILVTSADLVRGGFARREAVVLTAERDATGDWRIAKYQPDTPPL